MLEPSRGRAKISGIYRVKQPIDNLKIRVRIVQQKSLLAELFENEGETRDSNFLQDEEYEFSWQEKVLGPGEVRYYRDERNCASDTQKAYHRRIVDGGSAGSRLYSYVQADTYCPAADSNPLSGGGGGGGGEFRSCLSLRNEKAVAALTNRKPFGQRHNKTAVDERPSDRRIRENHYLYKEREAMYIVADLSPKDESSLEQPIDSEAVLLCSLTYDPLRKSLRLKPDFSAHECYSVQGVGMSYDYWIEHASSRPSRTELQRRRDLARKELERARNLKDGQLYHELRAPQPGLLRVLLHLDIESARDFDCGGALFVSYFAELPEHWTSASGRPAAGRTQRCRARDGVARFSHASEILLDLDLGRAGAAAKWPSLLFSVASLDSWTRYRIEGYGSLALPTSPGSFSYNLTSWRPAAGIVDGLRRFFTGGTCELDDITYCAVPAMHQGPSLDKSSLRVLPSGSLQLRLNAVHQSQQLAGCHRHLDVASLDRLNAGKLLSSVDDVLSQFKAARERMIQARAVCASPIHCNPSTQGIRNRGAD